MKSPILVGIDWSMQCPAICIYDPVAGPFNFSNCWFQYLITRKSLLVDDKNISSQLIKPYSNDLERFNHLADWALSVIPKGAFIAMEGYSLHSKGRIDKICENGGVLKNKLYLAKHIIQVVEPTSLKKFSSKIGNASKLEMLRAFHDNDLAGFRALRNLYKIKITKKKRLKNGRIVGHIDSPVQDIVDSYFLAKYLHTGSRI